MPKSLSLGALLSLSFQTVRRTWRTLLVGMVAVSILMVLMQTVLGRSLSGAADPVVRQLLGEERYRQVMAEIQVERGSPGTLNDLAAKVGDEVATKIAALPAGEEKAALQAVVGKAVRDLLPVVLLFVPLLFIVSLWARAFFLTVPLLPEAGQASEAVSRATRTFLPLFCVSVVTLFLSGLWLPFLVLLLMLMWPALWPLFALSLVVPVVLGPRFYPAPVLYLREGGILRSTIGSFRRTKGFWGKMVGNMILASVLVGIILWVVGSIVASLETAFPSSQLSLLFAWIGQMVQLAGTAYIIAFQVYLSLTVLGNPRQ